MDDNLISRKDITNVYGHEDIKGFSNYLEIPLKELEKIQQKNAEVVKKYIKSNFNF
jgi:hypothetical protein